MEKTEQQQQLYIDMSRIGKVKRCEHFEPFINEIYIHELFNKRRFEEEFCEVYIEKGITEARRLVYNYFDKHNLYYKHVYVEWVITYMEDTNDRLILERI